MELPAVVLVGIAVGYCPAIALQVNRLQPTRGVHDHGLIALPAKSEMRVITWIRFSGRYERELILYYHLAAVLK